MIRPAATQKLRRSSWIARLRRAVPFSQLRTALVLCVLFTSTFQSFVAQAHIHVPTQSATGSAYIAVDGFAKSSTITNDTGDRDRRTRGDSSSTCPLCQALALSGAPLAHSAHAVLVPNLLRSIVPIDRVPLASISAVSYSWTGRGPPLE